MVQLPNLTIIPQTKIELQNGFFFTTNMSPLYLQYLSECLYVTLYKYQTSTICGYRLLGQKAINKNNKHILYIVLIEYII